MWKIMNIIKKIKCKTNIVVTKMLSYESNKKRFTKYYIQNSFGSSESKSGEGSTIEQTAEIRKRLPYIFKKYNIKTLIDAPCGDYNWMRYVRMDDIDRYYGIDIVKNLIEKNKVDYGNEKIEFICADIINDRLPSGDMILCRDCLVHLKYKDGLRTIQNFKKNNIKYILITTFNLLNDNVDLSPGEIWRPLNMQVFPFNFPKPLMVINEGCTEDNNNYSDKCLGLYVLKDILI